MANFADQRKKRIVDWTNACVFLYGIMCIVELLNAFLPKPQGFGLWGPPAFVPWIYLCCHFFFLLRVWQEIPREFARTTPGMAAGLALVPVFHLYWQFVAFLGLYRDMNKAMEAYGHETRFDTAFVKFVCIAWVVVFMLFFILILIWMVVMIALANEAPTQYERPAMIVCALIHLVDTVLTVALYLNTQKKVVEFIDIKSSVEQ